MFRIGLGQDSHKIKCKMQNAKCKIDKPLILGGVLVDENIEVIADSDGDIILHSLFNAFSSAIGEKPLGFYATPLCKKGITDSKVFLQIILDKIKEKGFKIENVAITIEASKPRFENILEKIRSSLAKILKISKDQVGLSPTSGDFLTSFGKGEGIQVFSIILLSK